MPILVFLGLFVFDLCPMYVTDRHVRRASSLSAPYPRGGGIITVVLCNASTVPSIA